MTRDEALQQMATSLQRREPAAFFVGLVGYFIDGCPYAADGLSVDADSTPDLVLTDDGFVCAAFFPPQMLEPATVAARGTRELVLDGRSIRVVPVRLLVRRDDIWSLTESLGSQTHELFRDLDQFVEKKLAFARQQLAANVPADERTH